MADQQYADVPKLQRIRFILLTAQLNAMTT